MINSTNLNLTIKMSRPDEEELVDYDEAAEEILPPAPAAETNGDKADGDKKGSYVGIHSTGFRWVLLFWLSASFWMLTRRAGISF